MMVKGGHNSINMVCFYRFRLEGHLAGSQSHEHMLSNIES